MASVACAWYQIGIESVSLNANGLKRAARIKKTVGQIVRSRAGRAGPLRTIHCCREDGWKSKPCVDIVITWSALDRPEYLLGPLDCIVGPLLAHNIGYGGVEAFRCVTIPNILK